MLGSPTSSAYRSSIIDMDEHTGGHPTALKEEEEGSKIKCGSLIVQLEWACEGVQGSQLPLPTHKQKSCPITVHSGSPQHDSCSTLLEMALSNIHGILQLAAKVVHTE